jgi:hypothetical protein
MNMPIFLVLRGLASRAHVSDDYGLLLTFTGLISVFGRQYHRNAWASITWLSLPQRLRPGHLPAIFTDAYDGYESAILEAFGRRYLVPDASLPGRARRSVLR